MNKILMGFIFLFFCVCNYCYGQKIIRGTCNDMVYYEQGGGRFFLDKRADSFLGTFLQSGKLEFSKCFNCETCKRICKTTLENNEWLQINKLTLCSTEGKSVTVQDIILKKCEQNTFTYEVSFICCNRDLEVVSFILIIKKKNQRGKQKIVDFQWIGSELQI